MARMVTVMTPQERRLTVPTAVSASIGAYSRLFLLPRVFVGIFDSAIVALVSVVRTPFRPFAPLTETHVGQTTFLF